ncbi:MAG: regulatory protein RecX [Actinobacteria bacterium]|nr:regulatory protein RecX [Actinomycetota bacterium]
MLTHLKVRGIDDQVAQATIYRLQEAGLVNDQEFAIAWATSRHSHKKISKRVIATELRQKGVEQEQILEALESIDDDAEYQSAFELAMKKYATMSRLENDVQIRRIQSLLQRKGFGFPVIARVIRELGIGLELD